MTSDDTLTAVAGRPLRRLCAQVCIASQRCFCARRLGRMFPMFAVTTYHLLASYISHGVELARSTLCDWMAASAELLGRGAARGGRLGRAAPEERDAE